ncbi:methionyl-tRNA formyltransferase [Microbacterium sp. NPDC056057]|uniref:methionyl-tRNA formyltransferase n=1 Tax=Microbacterium sp. NPDC056057 TaxID=3345699 RepID=UPI0035D59DC0
MTQGLVVLGTKELCVRLVGALSGAGLPFTAVTVDDTPDVRSELERLRAARAIVAESPRDAYRIALSQQPAAVLVAGWYWLISDDVLEAVPAGFIGLHYSPLPRYRGSSPVVWALLNGDPELGYSVFRLSSGMDEGPIAASGRVPRGDGYIGPALDRLTSAAVPALVGVARGVLDGTAEFLPQPREGASYAAPRLPSDGRIDWTRAAGEVERFVRAQSRPYPGAFTEAKGETRRVWRATATEFACFGAPGQVVLSDDEALVVACGHGTGLRIERDEEWIGVRGGRLS